MLNSISGGIKIPSNRKCENKTVYIIWNFLKMDLTGNTIHVFTYLTRFFTKLMQPGKEESTTSSSISPEEKVQLMVSSYLSLSPTAYTALHLSMFTCRNLIVGFFWLFSYSSSDHSSVF